MSHLQGLKVVRGPDWMWSDQDGGEGNVGTVYIDGSEIDQKLLRPRMVSVVWESGLKAQYRVGPKGSHDLRVVDSSATGIKHPGISCDGTDCPVKEILGIRWQCVSCEVNLCTNCFMKEQTHNPDHNKFKRYDNKEIIDPPTVTGWSGNGPQSRIKLIGMIGHYHPEAFLVLDNPATSSHFPFRSATNPFCVGDRVEIDQESQMDETTIQVLDHSEDVAKVMGATGTVKSVGDSEILVHFVEKGIKLRLDPSVLIKLNKFSINQTIRIRDDGETIRKIEEEFDIESNHLKNNKPQGAVGRVMGFNQNDPDKVHIQFDNHKIYDWMGRYHSLPSSYLEAYQTVQPVIDEELLELDTKAVALFNRAVYAGDMRVAKLLHARFGMNVFGQNAEGQTALHIACQQGHPEMFKWLIDQIGIDLVKSDNLIRREIHHAVTRCNPDILKMLLKFEIDMNSRTKSGQTALDIAVDNGFIECAKQLILGLCDVNIQDYDGNTPLHRALMSGNRSWRSTEMIDILLDSGRIDWDLRNKKGFNIFHLDVYSKSLQAIAYFLKKGQQKFLLDWVSKSGHSVAFYAIKCRNIQAIKLMISESSHSKWLMDKLLGTKTIKTESSPLLYACIKKSCPIIELLVDAGADLKSVDKDGNTPIILAASSSSKDVMSTQADSPEIFKNYEHGANKKYPILPLLTYLIQKGCPWEVANNAGQKASDILLGKGCSKDLIDLLDLTALKYKRWPVGLNGCMGHNGECASAVNFRLSCPHKAVFETCAKCVPEAFKQKCACKDEDMIPIIPAVPLVTQPTEPEGSNERRLLDAFEWINDGSEKGYILDDSGNKYIWNRGLRLDGNFGYRCQFKFDREGVTCPATARRFVSETEEDSTILLESPHKHSSSSFVVKKESAAKRSKTTSAGEGSSSGSKQRRMSETN